MATEIKYEDAIRQLEDIVDEMSKQLKKAQQLIKLCKQRLTQTDAEIRKILSDE
jgi:exodeoxyribonuclease VII small subunit